VFAASFYFSVACFSYFPGSVACLVGVVLLCLLLSIGFSFSCLVCVLVLLFFVFSFGVVVLFSGSFSAPLASWCFYCFTVLTVVFRFVVFFIVYCL